MTVSTLGTAGAQSGGGIPVSTRGVGKPPPGAGMGTKAALENPKCNADTVQGWGTFSMVTTTGGPYCVAPAPKNNGGATARGVTGSTIKVVVVLPWPDTNGTGATNDRGAVNRATGEPPTAKAAALDQWAALSHVYETWGREVEFTFITASGLDETSQRADVVKIEQAKADVRDQHRLPRPRHPRQRRSRRTSTSSTATRPHPRQRLHSPHTSGACSTRRRT